MQLSVIILNYNVKYFLEACIKSVQKALVNLQAEIIVVDNASNDGSKEMMESVFPDVTYLYQSTNAGFPKGNNIGVQLAKGEFICILNPDTIVSETTFEKLIEEYKKLQNPGILGCHLIDGSGHFLPESKRGIPTPWVAFTKVMSLYKLFPKTKKFNQYYAQHVSENENGKVAILVGAFMFMKRELYLKVGGFDEGCFMYSDDIDLSYLALKQNLTNYYIATTSVIHFKGESTLKDGTYMKRFKEAMQFFYKKHFSTSFLFDVMMNLGILIFAFKKKTEVVSHKKTPDFFLILSKKNDIEIKNSILRTEKFTELEPLISFLENEIINNSKRIEVLYDSDFFSHENYINLLIRFKNRGVTFKLKPLNSEYFLGSNDKNDRGEVLFMK